METTFVIGCFFVCQGFGVVKTGVPFSSNGINFLVTSGCSDAMFSSSYISVLWSSLSRRKVVHRTIRIPHLHLSHLVTRISYLVSRISYPASHLFSLAGPIKLYASVNLAK
jgi:hypothetical protein